MTYSHVRTVSTAHASASAQTERKRHTIRAFRIRFTLPEKWKPGAEPRNWRIGPSKQPVISLGKQAERNGQPAGRAKWNIVELKRRPILLSPSGYAYYPRSIRANNTFKSGKYLANGPPPPRLWWDERYEHSFRNTTYSSDSGMREKLANKLTRALLSEWNSMFDDRTLRKEDNYSPVFYPLLWLSKYLPIPLGTR